jgi:hypothetical protein
LIDNVLVSLSIYYSIKAGNLLVFCSILDEALDFLLAILEVTAATFQLKSQVRFYFFNQAFGFTAAIRLLVFHVAETIHNTVEACAHLVTRISDIRIRFVTQIAKTSFRSETVVKDFPTNTGNIFCYTTDFLSNSTSSIRDIFVDTRLCFLNRSFYFLNISFVSLILSHTETAAAPKPPPTNAPPTAPHPEPQPEFRL